MCEGAGAVGVGSRSVFYGSPIMSDRNPAMHQFPHRGKVAVYQSDITFRNVTLPVFDQYTKNMNFFL